MHLKALQTTRLDWKSMLIQGMRDMAENSYHCSTVCVLSRAQADELAHVGTFWSYNGGVWRSEPNEQYEHFEHGEYDDDEYDDGDHYDDDDDHNEEDDALFLH